MRPVSLLLCVPFLLAGCGKVADGVESAGETVVDGAQGIASTATSLVNVNLSNVLNDLAVRLNVDEANIPINAQIPINIAANVCGVSINILSVSTGGSSEGCTAVTGSAELAQIVQQQMAAGGSVGGGGQTSGATTTTGTTSGTTTDTTTTTQPPPDPQH